MASGRDPRGVGSRRRLAGISHLFLGAPDASEAPATGPCLLPVVLDDIRDDRLLYAIARGLHARGHRVVVLHLGGAAASRDPRSLALHAPRREPGRVRARLRELSPGPEPARVCLLSASAADLRVLADYERVLVTAREGALRRAYAGVKGLVRTRSPALIGVAVVSAADRAAARNSFERLAGGARRFLGRGLQYAGCLVASEPAQRGAPGTEPAEPEGAGEIVDRLLGDGFLGHAGRASGGYACPYPVT